MAAVSSNLTFSRTFCVKTKGEKNFFAQPSQKVESTIFILVNTNSTYRNAHYTINSFALTNLTLDRDYVDTLVESYALHAPSDNDVQRLSPVFASSACSGYRYGFQAQEQDDEIKGSGNSYTAEFWQYDSRLGKRWNIDPVVKEHESPYATFANNPIWFIDPNGADTISVMSSNLDENGNELKKDENGNEIAGQKHLLLFKAYTEDDFKGEMYASDFAQKYQMLAKQVSSSTNGVSDSKPYAEFISANSNTKLLKNALFVTTVGGLNNFATNALNSIGGKGGGLK